MNYPRFLCSLLLFILCFVKTGRLFAGEGDRYITLIQDSPTAHVLEKGRLEFSFVHKRINNTLDIFNVKESIARDVSGLNLDDLGSIGDLSAYDMYGNIGLWNGLMLSASGGIEYLEVLNSTSKIDRLNIGLKYNLLPEGFFSPAISLKAGFKANRGSGITKEFKQITFNVTDDVTITKKYTDGQYLTLGGLKDNTKYVGIYAGKLLFSRVELHTFFEYGRTKVESEFDTSLAIEEIQRNLRFLEYKSHDYAIGVGSNAKLFSKLIFNFEYRYSWMNHDISGDFEGREYTKNHNIKAKFHILLTNFLALTFQGEYFSNQLIGEIPFIYNKRSASKFDNPYGYLGIGITFGYNYAR